MSAQTATEAAAQPQPGTGQARWARLPKVCLHDHLDGALRPVTVLELAEQCGHRLPARDAGSLRRWFEEAADSGSLVRYLETFEHTVAVTQSAAALQRVAREYVLDVAADGVVHAEVRWAPEQHGRNGLGPEEAVAAVAAGLAEGEEQAAALGRPVGVRQILCAMRHAEHSEEIARLAVAWRERGVVGFDLAGPEDGWPPARHRAALEHCARHFFPVTLHAGEAAGISSVREALVEGRALRLGHGVRLLEDLHPAGAPVPGSSAAAASAPAPGEATVRRLPGREDTPDPAEVLRCGETAAWVRDRGIALEVCPLSNLQTGAAPAVQALFRAGADGQADGEHSQEAPDSESGTHRIARDYAEHPVALLRELGFAVTINPDNRLMSSTSMTREFTRLAEVFGWGEEEFLEVTLRAARAAFLPAPAQEELVGRIQAGFAQDPEVGA